MFVTSNIFKGDLCYSGVLLTFVFIHRRTSFVRNTITCQMCKMRSYLQYNVRLKHVSSVDQVATAIVLQYSNKSSEIETKKSFICFQYQAYFENFGKCLKASQNLQDQNDETWSVTFTGYKGKECVLLCSWIKQMKKITQYLK